MPCAQFMLGCVGCGWGTHGRAGPLPEGGAIGCKASLLGRWARSQPAVHAVRWLRAAHPITDMWCFHWPQFEALSALDAGSIADFEDCTCHSKACCHCLHACQCESIFSCTLQVLDGPMLQRHFVACAAEQDKNLTHDTVRQADMVLQASCRWTFARNQSSLMCLAGCATQP